MLEPTPSTETEGKKRRRAKPVKPAPHSPARERLVREPERRLITGLSRTRWYLLEEEGRAPKRLYIDVRTVAWKLTDLERWVELRTKGHDWMAA